MTTVLFVITAADRWTLNDGDVHPSGYWAEEVAVPHHAFTEAGWDVTVSTPGGVAPTLDDLSLGISGGLPWKRRSVKRYLDSIGDVLASPTPLDALDAGNFDLVFYPGGHGPMEDLAYDSVSGAILTGRVKAGRPLALLCHAPAAINATRQPDGTSPFTGYRMTGLSNREELLNSFAKKAPWLLENRLTELGVIYTKARFPLRPHIEVDRNVYTGQNPMSSAALAERLIADLTPR